MLLTQIFEAPISAWTVDPDLDRNEAEMVSKFHGYDREMKHFSTKEKRLIRDQGHISRVTHAFRRSPVDFAFYFWQSSNPNYDLTAFKGRVDEAWLSKNLGQASADAIVAQTNANTISMVLTNNLSDEHKISLESPWIIAHRVAHALFGDGRPTEAGWSVRHYFDSFLKKLLTVGYDVEWPDEGSKHGRIFANDYREAWGKLLGNTLGTMKSVRDGKLVSYWEWWYESFAQFIITGKVTINPLPDHFDEGLPALTRDPGARKLLMREWARFPDRLDRLFTAVLKQSAGHIFVV